jgi:hypothetical protein
MQQAQHRLDNGLLIDIPRFLEEAKENHFYWLFYVEPVSFFLSLP